MGVEIVPIKQFAKNMSTGVSYFEQFVWDLEQRGVGDIDIPVLIYGIDSKQSEKQKKLWLFKSDLMCRAPILEKYIYIASPITLPGYYDKYNKKQ